MDRDAPVGSVLLDAPQLHSPARPPMTVITTRLTVSPEGVISSTTPLPVGEHAATVTVSVPQRRRSVREMPLHHEPWDSSISLRREDLYDDEGRLRE